jgi:hypothetical protein
MKQYRYTYTHSGDWQPSYTRVFDAWEDHESFDPYMHAISGTVRLEEREVGKWEVSLQTARDEAKKEQRRKA